MVQANRHRRGYGCDCTCCGLDCRLVSVWSAPPSSLCQLSACRSSSDGSGNQRASERLVIEWVALRHRRRGRMAGCVLTSVGDRQSLFRVCLSTASPYTRPSRLDHMDCQLGRRSVHHRFTRLGTGVVGEHLERSQPPLLGPSSRSASMRVVSPGRLRSARNLCSKSPAPLRTRSAVRASSGVRPDDSRATGARAREPDSATPHGGVLEVWPPDRAPTGTPLKAALGTGSAVGSNRKPGARHQGGPQHRAVSHFHSSRCGSAPRE
jgi:hypothetical protein